MINTKRTLFAAAAYAALVGLAVLATPGSGHSEAQGNGQPNGPDVRVVNKPTEPVPVTLKGTGTITGDVNVVNSPTVKLSAGTKVGIDSASNGVTVLNPSSQPVPVVGSVSNGMSRREARRRTASAFRLRAVSPRRERFPPFPTGSNWSSSTCRPPPPSLRARAAPFSSRPARVGQRRST